jgi:hypothetical protein
MGVVAAAFVLVHRARRRGGQQAHTHGKAGARGGYHDGEDKGNDARH